MGSTGAAQETGLTASKKATSDTSVHTGREKSEGANIPISCQANKGTSQVKTIGDTVASIDKKALVENLSDPLIIMKSWRQSTHSITR